VIYSAGAIAFYLLTGKRPGPNTPPAPSQVRPEIPTWLDRVVSLAMDLDPGHRYSDLKNFRAAVGAARSALALARRRGGEGDEKKHQAGIASPSAASGGCSHPPHPGMIPGPMSPLGRRRPGGGGPIPLRMPAPTSAPMLEKLQEANPSKPSPRYRFSWKVTLTRGVPILLGLSLAASWSLAWIWSLLGG
jgi:hypothetical protein